MSEAKKPLIPNLTELLPGDMHPMLESVGRSLVIGLTARDLDSTLMYINPAFVQMVGWTEEELLGRKPPYPYWPVEEVEKFTARLHSIRQSGKNPEEVERRFRRKNGDLFDALVMTIPLRNARGKVIGYLVTIRDISEWKKAEALLRSLTTQVMTAQEDERKRVAQELHDAVASNLTSLKYMVERKIEALGKGILPQGVKLEEIHSVILRTIEETRRIMINLRPSVLDDLGLLAAVSWFTREYQRVYAHIQVRKDIDLREEEIPEPLKIEIFRIVQEGMNNFAKHGKGNRIALFLKKEQGHVQLKIEDNGIGFDIHSSPEGMGLKNMEHRVLFSHGNYSITSRTGEGTAIRASWLLPPCKPL
jgi:PAS domain S-box-containing protein